MSHEAGAQPKVYRNLEILGKARSGNAKLQILLDSLCQGNHMCVLKGGGFSLQFKPKTIFLKLLLLLFRLFVSADT